MADRTQGFNAVSDLALGFKILMDSTGDEAIALIPLGNLIGTSKAVSQVVSCVEPIDHWINSSSLCGP